jgi:catechol 2,3-dioxygenase-like lactoylglutathione lyase family enzyme
VSKVDHHIGLKVASVERAAQFYVDALGGRYLTLPVESPHGQELMGGSPEHGLTWCMIGFESGAIELFEFDGGEPDWADRRRPGRLPHFGIEVDDVAAALTRVEDAGGSRVWPEIVKAFGTIDAIYCTDPDGNLIELISESMDAASRAALARHPEAQPS